MDIKKYKNNPKMPQHLALIIDGNGRWAKRRGLPRSVGHKAGFDNLKKQVEFIHDLGIKNLSLYCFSKENWKRPKEEVDYLMQMFNEMLDQYKEEYKDKDVRIIISGDLDDKKIPEKTRIKAKKIMEETKDKTGFILNPCINYGGRQEILKAVNELIDMGEKHINEAKLSSHLYTAEMLPVDFVIRTSGECRTSNFLPWQTIYSEWYFHKKMWPNFTKKDLLKALNDYMKRNRRFGAVKG